MIKRPVKLEFDPDNPSNGRVEVTIGVASVDTGVRDWLAWTVTDGSK